MKLMYNSAKKTILNHIILEKKLDMKVQEEQVEIETNKLVVLEEELFG
jgi:hypothetical protein